MSNTKDHNKQLSLLSIAYIIVGIILILWPGTAVKAVCYVISAILIIYGAYRIIRYFRSNVAERYNQFDLAIGIIAAVIGIFILIRPYLFASILPFVIGLCILVDSILKFQNALDLKKSGMNRWQLPMIISIITAVLGVILIINPFGATKTLVTCMGLFFIIDGIANIFSAGLVIKNIG